MAYHLEETLTLPPFHWLSSKYLSHSHCGMRSVHSQLQYQSGSLPYSSHRLQSDFSTFLDSSSVGRSPYRKVRPSDLPSGDFLIQHYRSKLCAPPTRRSAGRREKKQSFSISIYKVMVHPDTGISSKVMSIRNSFVNDIFERIAGESSGPLQPAPHHHQQGDPVRFLLPGELAKHPVSEGTKAVTKYTSSSTKLFTKPNLSFWHRLYKPWWRCLVHLYGKGSAIAPLVSHISEFPAHGYRSGSRHRTSPYRTVPYLCCFSCPQRRGGLLDRWRAFHVTDILSAVYGASNARFHSVRSPAPTSICLNHPVLSRFHGAPTCSVRSQL
ncbi:hypothetical protein LAZ67_2004918 [Cordylochernes scorpioides]|uniref:Uncharacterized protein n=1 Tax=Cordylochernes scorpioides TaxID=51811 RepID=A0ABY6K5K6_9ARAC|nr:hypothetical protein LAZ67_2004918 [Cordylochernes scorpioides]